MQGAPTTGIEAILGGNDLLAQLREKDNVGYGIACQNLLSGANERLTRPLKKGYRMMGIRHQPSSTV